MAYSQTPEAESPPPPTENEEGRRDTALESPPSRQGGEQNLVATSMSHFMCSGKVTVQCVFQIFLLSQSSILAALEGLSPFQTQPFGLARHRISFPYYHILLVISFQFCMFLESSFISSLLSRLSHTSLQILAQLCLDMLISVSPPSFHLFPLAFLLSLTFFPRPHPYILIYSSKCLFSYGIEHQTWYREHKAMWNRLRQIPYQLARAMAMSGPGLQSRAMTQSVTRMPPLGCVDNLELLLPLRALWFLEV